MNKLETHTAIVKKWAHQLGFDHCGIARARRLDEDADRLEAWLGNGFQGKMGYMENHFEMRVDPTKLVPGAKSVITVLMNYFPEEMQKTDQPQIAKYAYGQDYHFYIREKLKQFLFHLNEEIGEVQGRGFVDSAPVLERAWAKESGLGWIGKNGNLLTRHFGSFVFIATLIIDVELLPDSPFLTDHCGTCNKCVEACPTDAILPNKVIDGSRCISYLTIELKDEHLPDAFQGQLKNWVFGCDVCQDVCPWNRFAQPHHQEGLKPIPQVLEFSESDWLEITEDVFKGLFKKSAIGRPKFKGFQRNLRER